MYRKGQSLLVFQVLPLTFSDVKQKTENNQISSTEKFQVFPLTQDVPTDRLAHQTGCSKTGLVAASCSGEKCLQVAKSPTRRSFKLGFIELP